MTVTIDVSVVLQEQICPKCGIVYAVPDKWIQRHRDEGTWFRCPNFQCEWPSQHFAKSLVQKEREAREAAEREAEKARAATARERERRMSEERSHRTTKGHLTRNKKRAASGVCPCCNRSFKALARHMKTKHPGYAGATA